MSLPPDIIEPDDSNLIVNALIIANNGQGKTVLAGSAKSLVLAFESDVVPIKRVWKGETGAKVWYCTSWQKWLKAKTYLTKNVKEVQHNFDWIAIDSLPAAQRRLQLDMLRKAKKEDPDLDVDLMQWETYGHWYAKYKAFVGFMCDYPMDTLFTAIPMLWTTEDGEERTLPQITGSKGAIAEWTMAEMSCVGFMTRKRLKNKEMEVKISWEERGNKPGKDRYGTLAPYTKNITLVELARRARNNHGNV